MRSLLLAASLLLLAVSGLAPNVAADSPITGVFLSLDTQTPQTAFPSGTGPVYLNYTVSSPTGSDVEAVVYQGAPVGAPLLSESIDASTPGDSLILLFPPGDQTGSWGDGAYCTVITVDGVPQVGDGIGPISWTVGDAQPDPGCSSSATIVVPTATSVPSGAGASPTTTDTMATPLSSPTPTQQPTSTPISAAALPATSTPLPTATPLTPSPTDIPTSTPLPTSTPIVPPVSTPLPASILTPRPNVAAAGRPAPRHFILTLRSALRVGKTGTLTVVALGTHGRPVAGVAVTLDARELDLPSILRGATDSAGTIRFGPMRPAQPGLVRIDARKAGYATIDLGLAVE